MTVRVLEDQVVIMTLLTEDETTVVIETTVATVGNPSLVIHNNLLPPKQGFRASSEELTFLISDRPVHTVPRTE